MSAPRLITTAEAARRLGISAPRVRFYIKSGRLKAIRPARDYKIDPRDLAEFERRPTGRPAVRIPKEPRRCANCQRGLRNPTDGRRLCWICDPNGRLQRAAENARIRRSARRAAGLCSECGLRRPPRGSNACLVCREARRRRNAA